LARPASNIIIGKLRHAVAAQQPAQLSPRFGGLGRKNLPQPGGVQGLEPEPEPWGRAHNIFQLWAGFGAATSCPYQRACVASVIVARCLGVGRGCYWGAPPARGSAL